MKGIIKPEGLYEMTDLRGVKIIPFETVVVGTAVRFDKRRRIVFVDLGHLVTGFIPEDEVTVYELKYPEGGSMPCQITSIIDTQIRAIVTEVKDGNILKLSRKMSMIQGWEYLENNSDVMARVLNNVGYGIFFDIGNGLVAYNYKSDCTSIRISNTNLWFEVGDYIKVKLLDKGEDASSKINCSYKLAYPSMDEIKKIAFAGDIIPVKIGMTAVKGGYFCQVTPRINGIIDSNKELSEGETVMGRIKQITVKGVKLDHVDYTPD